MNAQQDLERRVSEWLELEARGELPDWVLEETLEHTASEPQRVTIRARLAALRPGARRHDEPWARRGFSMFTALRAAVVALLVGVVGLGAAFVLTADRTTPAPPAAETPATIEPVGLLDLTFDGAVIAEDLSGVLFSRKTYPTDQEISYATGFLPPNTFIRQIESGELGIRPNSDTQVIRAGHRQDEAEVIAAGEEALVGPGDTFIQRDVPWEEYGIDALGEMWTPGDDAVIFSIAIRESDRCCSMSHAGMVSRWYHTLTGGVEELRDAPVRFIVRRWDLPVGAAFTYTAETAPSLWAVDTGSILARPEADASDESKPASRPVLANSPISTMSILKDTPMLVENAGDVPAVLYQLIIEPAEAT